MQPAGGVDDQHVVDAAPRLAERALGDRHRRLAGADRDEAGPDLRGQAPSPSIPPPAGVTWNLTEETVTTGRVDAAV